MFHEDPLVVPQVVPPSADASARERAGVPWRFSDLVVAVALLLLGFGATVWLAFLLAMRGAVRSEPDTALLLALVTLALEGWSGAIVLLLARRRGISLADLGFRRPTSWSFVPLALLGAYGAMLAYGILILVLERTAGVDLSAINRGNSIPADLPRTPLIWGTLALAVVVVGPIGEELFFRALVYRGLARYIGPGLAIVASGFAFALVHANLSVLLPFALVGITFAWVYRSSGSLWTTILAHAIFNGISFAFTLYGVSP